MFNSIRDRIDAKVHGAKRLAKIVTSQQMKLNIGEFLKSKSRSPKTLNNQFETL
jgi:hypothetical protein